MYRLQVFPFQEESVVEGVAQPLCKIQLRLHLQEQ